MDPFWGNVNKNDKETESNILQIIKGWISVGWLVGNVSFPW